jgi:hypothetical protein
MKQDLTFSGQPGTVILMLGSIRERSAEHMIPELELTDPDLM